LLGSVITLDGPLDDDVVVPQTLSSAQTRERKASVTATLARFGRKPKPCELR